LEDFDMRRTHLMVCIAAALSAAPIAASAQQSAYVLNGAEIYAGPGQDYPLVARAGAGVNVRVQGCLQDYSWCDVSIGANRGWVYGGELGYAYQSRRVPVIEYGPQLALPVITFSLGNYWDRNYRGRTFYRERNDWERRWSDNRGGHEWRGNDRRGDWNRNNGNGRHDNDRRDYRNDNNRNDHRNDNDRGSRGNNNRVDGNLHGDGRGGYTAQPYAGPGDNPHRSNFDKDSSGHQQ
jgi:uncharacterized protein YraI